MSPRLTSANHPDKLKKWFLCLGCGRQLWTDRCHRICKKCRRRNGDNPARPAYRTALPRGAWLDEAPAAHPALDY